MKKAFKVILIVVVVLAIAFFGLSFWTKSHSPKDTVAYSKNGLEVTVDYCKPSKKERVVFGGLVPYGEVWRTGANEATTITFNKDVKVGGRDLKAGKYSLWTIPGESNWSIVFNEETGQWGTNYDASKDVLKVEASSEKTPETVEQFTIELKEANDADLILTWENTKVSVPIVKL
ncbi:MAG: DUF2911 domain-containing protein [Bacteroidota bacterium]|nr:DUF2911 domain-containing protein [Bacteroidota bacterium]